MDFSSITPFRLVRRLATVEPRTPSVYLLICDSSEMDAMLVELGEEVQVQLGVNMRRFAATELHPENLAVVSEHGDGDLVLVVLDRWLPRLVRSFDRNVVLLTSGGAVVLLATPDVAERLLGASPNLRSRFTDILVLRPYAALEDLRA